MDQLNLYPDSSSRLVEFFTQLGLSNIEVSHAKFAERLGRLIDLSDSFSLSESLRSLSRRKFVLGEASQEQPQDLFLQQRKHIVLGIAESFPASDVKAKAKFKLPNVKEGETLRYEPFKRFYSVHQSEMSFHVNKLRKSLYQEISCHSQSMAQLVELDKSLGGCLEEHTRKLFVVVPKLLGERFRYLQAQETLDVSMTHWLPQFHREMKQLLLAELDFRLLPLLGLVEAFNESVEAFNESTEECSK